MQNRVPLIETEEELFKLVQVVKESKRLQLINEVVGEQLGELIKNGKNLKNFLSWFPITDRINIVTLMRSHLSHIIQNGNEFLLVLAQLQNEDWLAFFNLQKDGVATFIAYREIFDFVTANIEENLRKELEKFIPDLPNMTTVADLKNALMLLQATQQEAFLKHIKNKLPQIIQTAEQLAKFMQAYPSLMTSVIAIIGENLKDILHNPQEILFISNLLAYYLENIIQKLGSAFPAMFNDAKAIAEFLASVYYEFPQVFDHLKPRLVELIKTAHDFHLILRVLQEHENRVDHFIELMKPNIKSTVKTTDDLVSYLAPNTRYAPAVLKVLENELPVIVNSQQSFYAVYNHLPKSTQFSFVLVLREKLPDIFVDKKLLKEVYYAHHIPAPKDERGGLSNWIASGFGLLGSESASSQRSTTANSTFLLPREFAPKR